MQSDAQPECVKSPADHWITGGVFETITNALLHVATSAGMEPGEM
jgi:hypothetical protein